MGHQRRRKDLYILEREDVIEECIRSKLEEFSLNILSEQGKYIYVDDQDGYKYRIVKYNFKRKPKIPHLYDRNPYAYHNLQTYLSKEYPNIKLVSKEYKDCKTPIEFICDKHKALGVQTTTLEYIYHCKDFCKGCINAVRGLRYRVSTERIIERCNELDLIYEDRYNNDSEQCTFVKFICPRHRNKGAQSIRWETLRTASLGCPFCYGRGKTTEEVCEELRRINDTYDYIGEYKRFEDDALCRCKICGNIWKTSMYSLIQGSGCPKCALSRGESRVSEVLDEMSIEYVSQHTFNECVHIKKLRFDFYIPQYNMVIEYDGEQHYEPVDFANKGTEWATELLIRNQNRDAVKNKFCKDNGILLLRIPYWEYENIESIIKNFIKDIQESQETAG